MLSVLLHLSRWIDAVNERVGAAVSWLVLLAVVISAGNAMVRYLLNSSSNAWLEAQWYLFSGILLLCAGYTLLRNDHIRIDIVSNLLSPRARIWIDVLGSLFFLLPVCAVLGLLSWPLFVESYARHEISGDAGGLLRWPVKLLMPAGFLLLAAQGISEIIKRAAQLADRDPGDAQSEAPAARTGQR